MSEFEFLRDINIGQYLPIDSPLHHLDARAKLILFGVVLAAVTFSPHPAGLLAGLLAVAAGLALGRIPVGFAIKGLAAPAPFILLVALLQVVINPYPDSGVVLFQKWGLLFSASDLIAGGMVLGRFLVLVLGISLATFCMSTSELTQGLGALLRPLDRIGLPAHDLVMMVQVTLRFLPMLAQNAERIAKAQASRGADWGTRGGGLLKRIRQVLPLLLPLFLTSLKRAENLAMAMDARGYGSIAGRTSMTQLHIRVVDILAVIAAVLLSGLIVLL